MQRRIEQAIRSTILVAGATLAASAQAASPAACVKVTSDATYGNYGYDHIVHVTNGCTASVTCAVSTDVNSEPTRVTIAPGERADVLTFRGSPARTFTPHTDCRFSR